MNKSLGLTLLAHPVEVSSTIILCISSMRCTRYRRRYIIGRVVVQET